jgi:hypothetical protein
MVTLPCDQYGNPVDEKGSRVWDVTKHINSRKSIATPVANTTDAKAPEPPSLDQDKYDAMVKFIVEGKFKEVEQAIKKYKLNDSQKKLLTTMINQSKAEAVTKAAKK